MIDFEVKINRLKVVETIDEIFINKPVIKLYVSDKRIEFMAWGDPISNERFKENLTKHPDIPFIINNLFGHYYFVLLDKSNNSICAGNSLFGILPLYYREEGQYISISNNPISIRSSESGSRINKRFILENILFNYPLFNHSFIQGIDLLPANCYIMSFQGRFSNIKHTEIEKYFSESPVHWSKAAARVSDVFIETTKKYFPDEPCFSSITGGFDGRTLASCGLYYKKNFSTYCFGNEGSADVKIAKDLSRLSGISFKAVDLDVAYINGHSKNCGLEFIKGANGCASFSRAHYLYTARELSREAGIILTGNFGSEILRTPNSPGVVVSPNLLLLLKAKSYSDGLKALDSSPEWNWINRSSFREGWESLKEDIATLPWFGPARKDFSINQHFYTIIFNEVFRKYFGAEMVNQFRFLSNRSPFLDIDFLKELLGTGLAGVNSGFLAVNPLKRFKGQVLYAHIINKTFPALGVEITDKGYPPDYLLSFKGNVKLIGSYAVKVMNRRQESNNDPYSVDSSFNQNRDFWERLASDGNLFNRENLRQGIKDPRDKRDSLFIALSQSYFFNSISSEVVY